LIHRPLFNCIPLLYFWGGTVRTKEEVEKEIENMKKDYEKMKILPIATEEKREHALFCQQQVIDALMWVLGGKI